MLAFNDTRYTVYDNFPSRIVSPIYPFLLLGSVFAGSWFNHKVKIRPIMRAVFTCITILFVIYRGALLVTQIADKKNYVSGAEYSESIATFCQDSNAGKKYLLIQAYSRNHVGQSLKYFCPNMVSLNFENNYSLNRGDTIYSPYDIAVLSVQKESEYISSDGTKRVFMYRVMKDTKTNFTQIKKTLHMLD